VLSVLVNTLGCKLNQLESEAFTDAFIQAGFVLHNRLDTGSPSIIVVNTCTVTSKADQKARRVIRKSLRDYPDSIVLVTGCYAQLDQEQISGLDTERSGRLFVIKGMEKNSLLNLPGYFNENAENLKQAVNTWKEGIDKDSVPERDKVFQFLPDKFSSHTRGLLKIQDGCDNHCTYCRIRLARGKSISLEAEQVLARLQILEESHSEAVLTGVNISLYRDKTAGNLGGLLDYLLAGTRKISLRLSSLEPECIDEGLSKILSHKRIRPHFHLSIQSGSRKILERMGRSYNSETIENAVMLLRRIKDDPFLACDIIAGFPGETEDDFNETFALCQRIGFSWIHVFPYSKRPGTPAFSFSDTVQEKEISARVKLLTDLAWHGRAEYVRGWLGRETEVLIEKSSGRLCRGVSENYLKLHVKYTGNKAPSAGTVLSCRLPAEQEINCRNEDYDAVAILQTEY
jgi:threonylcarbamoyladenosine tRNA methylthiotransferase MtaB